MGNMFSKPEVQQAPEPKPTTPLPIRDDEAMRKEKMKTYTAAAKRSGAESTKFGRMGDGGAPAETRSMVLGGG